MLQTARRSYHGFTTHWIVHHTTVPEDYRLQLAAPKFISPGGHNDRVLLPANSQTIQCNKNGVWQIILYSLMCQKNAVKNRHCDIINTVYSGEDIVLRKRGKRNKEE